LLPARSLPSPRTHWRSRRRVRRRASGRTVAYNLRFPGQVFDGQAGLHYNYFRDYDPAVGKYVEGDPIGLGGASYSTYAYTRGNPVSNRDPSGECPWCAAAAAVGAAANAFNNYGAYASGEISGWQYFEDIAVGAGTGYLSGIPGGGLALQLLLGGATAGANEGIQELVNGNVNPCKIKVAASIGMSGPFLGILGESIGNKFARSVIGNLLTAGNGYGAEGALWGFAASLAVGALPIPDWVNP